MRPALSPDAARILNLIAMLGIVAILLGAYGYQFTHEELPCTLCLLQRVAMLGVAFGAAMNLMLGPRPRHYGVSLVSATFGLLISLRQTLLHINPYFDKATGQPTLSSTANPAFGEALFGLHLYVWGVVIFGVACFLIGIVLLFDSQFRESSPPTAGIQRMATIGVATLLVVATLEFLTTFAECGFGDCPNDGSWNWWLFG